MPRIRLSLALAAAALALTGAARKPTILFIAGDSTAAHYPADRYPQTGWGMLLPCALGPGVRVENRARGGRSTRTFIGDGLLDAIAADIRRGDTLLIQFGHNDAYRKKPERYIEPAGFVENLKRFVAVARDRGAQPVLLTPVTQRTFEGQRVVHGFADYAAATRAVAAETKTPLIDLERLSGQWVERAGPEPSKRLFLHYTPADNVPAFPQGIADDTHFSELGARGLAEIVAERLRALRLPVSKHVLARRPTLTVVGPLGHTGCKVGG